MKQQTKGGALHRLWQALPWLWMAAAYLFDLWYQLVPGKWIVDSDLASEMILSDLLNREGSIISQNPGEGASAKLNTRVSVVVSAGPEPAPEPEAPSESTASSDGSGGWLGGLFGGSSSSSE